MVVVHVADQQRHAADFPGQVIERLQALRHELRFENQIPRRIADQRELGCNDEVRAPLEALAVGRKDAFHVAGEVADDGVDLSEADFHEHRKGTPQADAGKMKNAGNQSIGGHIPHPQRRLAVSIPAV